MIGTRRIRAVVTWGGVWSLLAIVALLARADTATDDAARWIVAFETPSEHVLHELATADGIDVRWVEPDLVLAEVRDPDEVPRLWGARRVVRRTAGDELALLHGRNIERLRRHADASTSKVLRRLSAAHVATVHAARDEVWVLLGPSTDWPRETLGCQGALILPMHDVDPRSVIRRGPPRELEPWVMAPKRAWTPGERAVLDAVNEDSLVAYFDLLTKNTIGLAANRYVFSPDLAALYVPRVQAAMQAALAGIPQASVELQEFVKTRNCAAGVDSVQTANVIARLPGSVPGTGTLVICAHLDATGSKDRGPGSWAEARSRCEPTSQTPGGEDNASGVASMIEVLRCIADGVRAGTIDFAFDIEFVAFSGEEDEGNDTQPGGLNRFLTGSEFYVQQRVAANVNLLAAFNLDMVGSQYLGSNLQLVHNAASAWLAEFVVEAAAFVTPPLDITFTPDQDEALSSDHNSFWAKNVTAILGADAPVETLRNYATYHRPEDTGFDEDVVPAKMREVAKAVVGTLLRFDTQVHATPALFVPVESFRTFVVLDTEVGYDHTFLRLFPGDVVDARLKLYNLGAEYSGPVRLTVRKDRHDGTSTTVMDDTSMRVIPTGGMILFDERIPILESDSGVSALVAAVSWNSCPSCDLDVTAIAVDSLVVRGRHNPEKVAFRPNPAPSLADAEILVELTEAGTLTVDVYNLEGQQVYSGTQRIPGAAGRIIEAGDGLAITVVPLATAASTPLRNVVSGSYFARVQFRGDDGSNSSGSARLVVIR